MIARRVRNLGFAALACATAAGCVGHDAALSISPTQKMETALASRRPGEVTAYTKESMQRLAYRYNTTNRSYSAAIDLDRDLARAEAVGPVDRIAARIDLAANLAAAGRLTEAQTNLEEAEVSIADNAATLSPGDRRVLRVKLLIGRSLVIGQVANRAAPGDRASGFAQAAVLAAWATTLADQAVEETGPGQGARRVENAIVLDPITTAAYNAGHRASGVGDIVSRPMSASEKLAVLKVQAEYTQAVSVLESNDIKAAALASAAAESDLRALPPGTFAWLRAEIALQQADLLERTNDLPGAQKTLEAARDNLRRSEGASRLEAFVLQAVSRIQQLRGDNDGARESQKATFDILSQQTDGRWPTRPEVTPYLQLLGPSAAAGNAEDVRRFFAVASMATETQTANTVADMAARFASGDNATGAAMRGLQFARQRLDRVTARLNRLHDAKASTDLIKAGDADRLAAQIAVKDAADLVEKTAKSRASSVLSPRVELSEVQAVLRPGEAYLRFIFLDDGSGYAVLVRPDNARLVALKGAEADVAQTIVDMQGYTKLIMSGDGASPQLSAFRMGKSHKLFEDLLGGLVDDLKGVSRLTIEPAGPLFSLPFGALLTAPPPQDLIDRVVASRGRDYSHAPWLARDKAIDLSVGSAAFVRLRKTTPAKSQKILAFADPTPSEASEDQVRSLSTERETRDVVRVSTDVAGSPGQACRDEARHILSFAPLKDTADEALAAVTFMGADKQSIIAGPDFTDDAVRKRTDLNQYGTLLFATHAALPEPKAHCWPDPFLITSRAATAGSEGLLDTGMISNLDLDANLVVLSACNTDGASAGGQALGGLAQSFIFAGSRGVMVSHWSVSSSGTTSLMSEMFRSLGQQHMSATDALATAERAMMDQPDLSHPYFWAAFTTIGGVDAMPQGH